MNVQYSGMPFVSGWPGVKARYVLAERQEPAHADDEIVTCFRDGQVTLRSNRRTQGFTNAIQEYGYKAVEPGDLVVHSMDAFAGAIGVSDSRGKMSPVVGIYRVPNGDSRFYAYFLRAASDAGYIQSLAKGIRERSTSFDRQSLSTIIFPNISIDEQRRISDFLDDQVARIDSLVRLRSTQVDLIAHWGSQQLWALLGIRRGSVTTESRTWLDGLPSDCDVQRLRRLCKVMRGASPRPIDDPKYFSEADGRGWIRISDVSAAGKYLRSTTQRLSKLGESLSVSVDKGDLILSISASVGKPCIVAIPCCIHDGFVALRDPSVDVEYLYYVLAYGDPFAGVGNLGTQVNLNSDIVGRTAIPVPNHERQLEIAVEMRDLEVQIESLHATISEGVKLLEERKRALITAAVTGQMDVTTAKPIGMGKWVPNIGATIDTHVNSAATAAASIGGI